MKSLKEQLMTESKFGYTYENALIVALKALLDTGEEDKVKLILAEWFNNEDTIRSITTFLYHAGYDISVVCGESDKRTSDDVAKLISTVKLGKKKVTIDYPR